MLDAIRSLLPGGGTATTVIRECRNCGCSVDADGSTCPNCGGDEVARYEVP